MEFIFLIGGLIVGAIISWLFAKQKSAGTYDFDLDKVRSLAEFAQEAAQNKTSQYFND